MYKKIANMDLLKVKVKHICLNSDPVPIAQEAYNSFLFDNIFLLTSFKTRQNYLIIIFYTDFDLYIFYCHNLSKINKA